MVNLLIRSEKDSAEKDSTGSHDWWIDSSDIEAVMPMFCWGFPQQLGEIWSLGIAIYLALSEAIWYPKFGRFS